MSMDPELLHDFVVEIKSLDIEFSAVVSSLKANVDQPLEFAKFAQVIDRIYGTASTFGFKEFASYCGMMKKVCVDCSKTHSTRGQTKVLELMENYLANVGKLLVALHSPEAMLTLRHTLHLDEQKAKKILDQVLKFATKAA